MTNPTTIFFLGVALFSGIGFAYIDIQQYCRAFDANFRPIICILKNNNTQYPNRPYPSYPPPGPAPSPEYPILYPIDNGPPVYTYDHEDDDDECSCELTCYPSVLRQNDTGVRYKCRSCGSSCPISTSTKATPSCSCAVPSGNATCNCTATCASFRHGHIHHHHHLKHTYEHSYESDDSTEDSNCIFNVVNFVDRRVGDEQRPYDCECCKTKAAQDTGEPDFVCICQRVSGTGSRNRRDKTKFSDPLKLFKITNRDVS